MKPEKETITYYDWNEAWEYLEKKHGLKDEISKEDYPKGHRDYFCVWNYIVGMNEIHNGSIFILSDWDLKNGFENTLPEFWVPVLETIMEEFGEEDGNCLSATFRVTW